jgi:hypothetical protein
MLNKKKIAARARECEGLVCTTIADVAELIEVHAELGHFEIEIFITKKLSPKIYSLLDSKGFYCRTFDFASLEHECKLYVSWDF